MIAGKYLTDSNITIDLFNKKAVIDYGYYPTKTPFLKHIHSFLYPFFIILWSLYFLIHYTIIIPFVSRFKFFNQLKYLSFMNSLYSFLFGYKTAYYEGELNSTQITIHSSENLEFNYELTGDYELYCQSISLKAIDITRTWFKTSYPLFSGWMFIITFSQIPKEGTATINYL